MTARGGRRLAAAVLAGLIASACGAPAGEIEPPRPGAGSIGASAGAEAADRRVGPAAAPPVAWERVAYRLLDFDEGRVVGENLPERLARPTLPGSILKIVTLLAGLETGAIEPDTRILCRRDLRSSTGRDLSCSHPELHRPLGPAEALAHSCNSYLATVAGRVPASAVDAVRVRLGLPATDPGSDTVEQALGLAGPAVAPERLLLAFDRLFGEAGAASGGSGAIGQVLRDGLIGSAREGTASALGRARLEAFAKTGTAPDAAGGFQGLALVAWPISRPRWGLVVLGRGIAGMDAADLAARLIAAHDNRRQVTVGRLRGGTYEVERLGLEDYVAGVVAAEASPAAGAEARRALAVLARTYVLANPGRHAGEGFDVCDLTHCQVLRQPDRGSALAASATAGIIARESGRPAQVFYTAACGGRTEDARAVWPDLGGPHLASVRDPGCEADAGWQAELRVGDLERALQQAGHRGGPLRDLTVVARNGSGRVALLRAEGLVPETVSAEAFRLAVGRALGWQFVKSTSFAIARTARGFRFEGRGLGHGVGVCIRGAERRSAAGQDWSEILATYLPGLSYEVLAVEPSSASELRVDVPARDERHRGSLHALIATELRLMAAELQQPVPRGLVVRFHPTVESFRRETSQPWWVAGRTLAGRIDLLPLDVLDDRGILRSTIRHELAHLLTQPYLSGRPRWVQEGAAIHFAGETLPAPEDSACPSDAELAAAASPDALRALYGAAAACFSAALAPGIGWKDVGRR